MIDVLTTNDWNIDENDILIKERLYSDN